MVSNSDAVTEKDKLELLWYSTNENTHQWKKNILLQISLRWQYEDLNIHLADIIISLKNDECIKQVIQLGMWSIILGSMTTMPGKLYVMVMWQKLNETHHCKWFWFQKCK